MIPDRCCGTCHPGALAICEEVFGSGNIVFGSDWPFPMGLLDPHRQLAHLDADQRAAVLRDNAAALARATASRERSNP